MSDKKRSLIFINLVITCIASSLLATALTTALPPIMQDLSISATTGQWLTSGYSLVMAITMPLTAFLINRFRTKVIYPVGIVIFLLGLGVCIIAPNFPVMMVGRCVQAIGNGMLSSMAQVIILSMYPAEKKGKAMGWYGLSVSAAPIVAPTLAGLLVDHASWRWIFIIAFIIMFVSLVYALLVFADVIETEKSKFDIFSFILSAFAFGGITLGVGNIGSYGFASWQTLVPLIIGVVTAVFFVYRQLHLNEPFLELRTLKDKDYTMSVIGSMFLYLIVMGSSICMPLYIQQTLGLSATVSALVTLPGSLVSAIISPFAGRIFDRIGIKILFVAGAICLVISNGCMFFFTMQTPVWAAAIVNVFRNAAVGCLLMPLVTWGAGGVPRKMTAHATALLTSLRTIAGAIGSAIFVAVMTVAANSYERKGYENASMHGVNMTFVCMAACSAVLLLVAIFGVRKKKSSYIECQ